jgi:hypothetical protein
MKVGRNDPCPCGSGKKYKKCHLPQEQAARTAAAKEEAAKAEAAEADADDEDEEDAAEAGEGEGADKEAAPPKKKPRAERGGVRPAAGAPKPTMHRRKV